MVRSVLKNSNHPLSRILYGYIEVDETVAISNYKEVTGKGQQAEVNGKEIKVGSAVFVGLEKNSEINQTKVYIAIDGEIKGKNEITNIYRIGQNTVVDNLNEHNT